MVMHLSNMGVTTYVLHKFLSISSSSRVLRFVLFDICMLLVYPQREANGHPGRDTVVHNS